MTGDESYWNSGFEDWQSDSSFLSSLRGGPFIAIQVDPANAIPPTRMPTMVDMVRDLSARLDAAEIGYMLTGSMVMNCYDLPCVPRNLDIVVALQPADAEVMVRLFNHDYELSREAVDSAIAQQSYFLLSHRANRLKVNCIICQQIKYRLTEFNRRQRVKFENFQTWIVSKEDLVISKLHWARKSRSPRHLRAVKNLAATGCDRDYIERWTRALGIFRLWEECSQE